VWRICCCRWIRVASELLRWYNQNVGISDYQAGSS